MNEQIQNILNENGTKTSKIQKLLTLGLTRRQVADLVAGGNYGFVQNVYKRMMQGMTQSAAQAAATVLPQLDYTYSLIRNYVYKCDLKLNISQYYNEERYKVGDEERDEYEQIKARFLDDEMMEYRNNNIFLEMTQKMQHAYCCTADKFEKVNDLFCKIKQEETIIFCKYIDSRVACEKEYPKSKVLSYQKEALGLNLQSYRYMIFFDKIWDYALRIQATRRIYRTGQPMDCVYYDLTGNVGLEHLIDSNIEKKISMTEYFKKKSIEDIKKEL